MSEFREVCRRLRQALKGGLINLDGRANPLLLLAGWRRVPLHVIAHILQPAPVTLRRHRPDGFFQPDQHGQPGARRSRSQRDQVFVIPVHGYFGYAVRR